MIAKKLFAKNENRSLRYDQIDIKYINLVLTLSIFLFYFLFQFNNYTQN